ncbi:haloacid dehalogenase-like hydrolase [Halieaceae bacterium]|nr:haloacid dehalogenase-like hydrolase [Halieaceae bacterium]
MRALFLPIACLFALLSTLAACQNSDEAQAANPLPSWQPGETKQKIIDFVETVTDPDSANYVAIADRVAVFDHDGTLLPEFPLVQLKFAIYRLHQLVDEHPEWREQQPFKAALEGDLNYVESSHDNLFKVLRATHAGMTQNEFAILVQEFFRTQQHPRFKQLYTQTAYQPMVELVAYLQSKAFKTYIVSGGGVDFIRQISVVMYGIPREHIIGSWGKTRFEQRDDQVVIHRESSFDVFLEKRVKAESIDHHLGKRPTIAVGNVGSGSDVEMLLYSASQSGPSLQLMIDHDDADREFAYAEKVDKSLAASERFNWQVVSVKNDWRQVFSFETVVESMP